MIGHAVQVGNQWVAHRAETVYDASGRRDQEIVNLRQVWSFNPNASGVGAAPTIDRTNARTTSFEYDARGQVVKTVLPDGSFTSATFDSQGRQLTETDQAGQTKTFEYDVQGRLTAVILPVVPDLNNVVNGQPVLTQPRYEYGYNAQGQQTLLRDPLGHETWFTFDAQGRQLTRTLPLGFGQDGKKGTADDAAVPAGDFTERFEYDDLGRQTLHVSFEGVVTQSLYDSQSGRQSEQRFFANLADYNNGSGTPGETWSFQDDAFGRPTQVTRTTGSGSTVVSAVQTTAYNSQGQVIRLTSPEGIVGYEYDNLGRKTKTYTLDATMLDNNGGDVAQATLDSTSYGYDLLGRLQSVTVTRRLGADLSTPEVTRYGYDLLGNLARQDMPNGVITIYVYDSLNRLDTLTHYRGVGVSPTLDTDLTDNPKVAEFDYSVLANGQRSGMTERFWIDEDATADVVNNYAWTYDGLNRLTDEVFTTNLDDVFDGQTEVGLAANSTLGASNRAMRDYHDHYSFDLTGNRLAKTTDLDNDGWVDSWTSSDYDANDRLHVEGLYQALPVGQPGPVGVSQQTVYEYDQTQQTKKTVFNGSGLALNSRLSTLNFSYDLQGRPAIATSTTFDGTTGAATHIERTAYDYDHTGIRVSASTDTLDPADGTTVQSTERVEFLNDPQNFTGYSQVIRETHRDGSGQLTEEVTYTFGLDELSQTTVTFENGQANSPTTVTFSHDGHGSVRALLDAAAAIATLAGSPAAPALRQLFTYDAYGNAIGFNMSAAATVLLYSGEQFDQRVEMQYLRARFYDAANGRFVGLDPFFGNSQDPLSFHKYLYTHANPINGIDPTGMMTDLLTFFSNMSTAAKIGTLGAIGVAAYWVSIQGGNIFRYATAYTTTVNLYITPLSAAQQTDSDYTDYRQYLLQHTASVEKQLSSVNGGKTKFQIIDGAIPNGVKAGYDRSTKTISIPVDWREQTSALAQGLADKMLVFPKGFAQKLQFLQTNNLLNVPVNSQTKSQYLANTILHEMAHCILSRASFRQWGGVCDHTGSGLMGGNWPFGKNMSFSEGSQALLDYDAGTKSELRVALGYEWALW